MQIDVTIIIVNYNTKNFTQNCLNSIYAQTQDIAFEVIVSDNGSSDGSVEMIKTEFPQVILIENCANIGFGAANNRALKIANGKYIFYLNSDTILLNNAVKIFFDYWEDYSDKKMLGALGSNLFGDNGQYVHSFGQFPIPFFFAKSLFRRYVGMTIRFLFPFMRKYKSKNMQFSFYEGNVDYITGADLFLKNDANAFFDERYFMYTEEADLQYRLYLKGLVRKIIGGPKIIHFEGGSDKAKNQTLLQQYASFGKINIDISNLKFIKFNISLFCFFVLRFFVFICWLHPAIFKNTKSHVKELFNL